MVVRGYTELLRLAEGAARDEYADRVAWGCQLMAEIVENGLDLCRLEEGQWRVERRSVDLAKLVQDCIAAHRLAARRKGVRLTARLDEKAELEVDPMCFCRMLANLLSNAIKFTTPSSTVTTSLRVFPSRVELTVRDQGPGIPPAEQRTIFEPFVTGGALPTGGECKTGLGLAIVQRLANAHGAEVRLSSPRGGGSTFTILFPRPPPNGS